MSRYRQKGGDLADMAGGLSLTMILEPKPTLLKRCKEYKYHMIYSNTMDPRLINHVAPGSVMAESVTAVGVVVPMIM